MSCRCLIVDDEYLAGQILAGYLSKFPELELVAVCTRPAEALLILNQESIDLLFLDIQMPGMDGFQLISSLKHRPIVVMTTARHDQAIRAYEMAIFDYLLKPVSFDRFSVAVNRVVSRLEESKAPAQKKINRQFLQFKANYQTHQVDFDKILYLEGLKEYVRIVAETETFQTLGALKSFKEQLSLTDFVQVHRSYVLNRSQIASYSSAQASMSNGDIIPIGRNYRKSFQDAMS